MNLHADAALTPNRCRQLCRRVLDGALRRSSWPTRHVYSRPEQLVAWKGAGKRALATLSAAIVPARLIALPPAHYWPLFYCAPYFRWACFSQWVRWWWLCFLRQALRALLSFCVLVRRWTARVVGDGVSAGKMLGGMGRRGKL
jgi:hypothetical protein